MVDNKISLRFFHLGLAVSCAVGNIRRQSCLVSIAALDHYSAPLYLDRPASVAATAYKMRMDDKLMRSFCVAKSFKESESGTGIGKIQSVHFSLDGENLITCSDDDQIIIYDCQKGYDYFLFP